MSFVRVSRLEDILKVSLCAAIPWCGHPRQSRKVSVRMTHNRMALMHDSIVGRNGANTGPALESGVAGSSGSFSNSLGATPSSRHVTFLCQFNLSASRPLPGISSLQQITTFPTKPD